MRIQSEQQVHHREVFDAIRKKKSNDLVRKLGLFIDKKGIIRCAHQLQNADLSYGEKFPILLPKLKSSRFTRLLIRHFHMLVYHQGTAYTFNQIRREFWIPQGQAAVSSVILGCEKCKPFMRRPYTQPKIWTYLPSG